MSYGQAELHTLLTDSSITALVDSDNIYYDTVVPDEDVSADTPTINYYRVGLVDGGLNYMQTTYSVNCRNVSQATAEAVARAVFDVLNRHESSSVFFVVSVLPVIPPADPTDVYNSPVEVTAKGRSI